MSPSGGSMDNSFIDGSTSVGVMLGSSIAPFFFDSLEVGDKRRLRGTVKSLIANKQFIPNSRYTPDIDSAKRYIGKVRDTYKKKLGTIGSRYNSLRGGARMIGYGYGLLFAAQTIEGMVTPGLTASASMEMQGDIQQGPLDSGQAYTQRQRSLQAIFDSQMGIRNVIGQEAAFFHR